MLHQSTIKDAAPMRLERRGAQVLDLSAADRRFQRASAAMPSLWPIGARRRAAETRLPQNAVR